MLPANAAMPLARQTLKSGFTIPKTDVNFDKLQS